MGANDRELIAVMRRYFAAKAELKALKAKLEAARQAEGGVIDAFYDPRRNLNHAVDLQRSHRLKGEMVSLMQRAEAWGRVELASDRAETRAGEDEPSGRLFNAPFGA
ncbi:hypothetical protein [Rhizobium sp. LjRoot258]|uniref:hypothetical protein n=1 Tax=Rhizobium sp. LjRoot258 TaxID=3342299 RepID=UPI003F501C98